MIEAGELTEIAKYASLAMGDIFLANAFRSEQLQGFASDGFHCFTEGDLLLA